MGEIMENEQEVLYPELQDILNRIHAYNISHKEGCFLYSFVGWEKDKECRCEECGDFCDKICDEKSMLGAYGDLGTLRTMMESLRNIIEGDANTNEDEFVNF